MKLGLTALRPCSLVIVVSLLITTTVQLAIPDIRAIAPSAGALRHRAQAWRKPIAHNPYSTPITCFLSQNLADRIPNLYDNIN